MRINWEGPSEGPGLLPGPRGAWVLVAISLAGPARQSGREVEAAGQAPAVCSPVCPVG